MSHKSEPWYEAVVAVAEKYHAGQVDRCGEPYIEHLKRTAEILARLYPDAGRPEIEAAILHDVFEDTPASAADLLAAGVSPEAISIAAELTKPPGAHYQQWIVALTERASTGALRVKLADNTDNRDPRRVRKANLLDQMLTKYEPARHAIEAELADRRNRANGLIPERPGAPR